MNKKDLKLKLQSIDIDSFDSYMVHKNNILEIVDLFKQHPCRSMTESMRNINYDQIVSENDNSEDVLYGKISISFLENHEKSRENGTNFEGVYFYHKVLFYIFESNYNNPDYFISIILENDLEVRSFLKGCENIVLVENIKFDEDNGLNYINHIEELSYFTDILDITKNVDYYDYKIHKRFDGIQNSGLLNLQKYSIDFFKQEYSNVITLNIKDPETEEFKFRLSFSYPLGDNHSFADNIMNRLKYKLSVTKLFETKDKQPVVDIEDDNLDFSITLNNKEDIDKALCVVNKACRCIYTTNLNNTRDAEYEYGSEILSIKNIVNPNKVEIHGSDIDDKEIIMDLYSGNDIYISRGLIMRDFSINNNKTLIRRIKEELKNNIKPKEIKNMNNDKNVSKTGIEILEDALGDKRIRNFINVEESLVIQIAREKASFMNLWWNTGDNSKIKEILNNLEEFTYIIEMNFETQELLKRVRKTQEDVELLINFDGVCNSINIILYTKNGEYIPLKFNCIDTCKFIEMKKECLKINLDLITTEEVTKATEEILADKSSHSVVSDDFFSFYQVLNYIHSLNPKYNRNITEDLIRFSGVKNYKIGILRNDINDSLDIRIYNSIFAANVLEMKYDFSKKDNGRILYASALQYINSIMKNSLEAPTEEMNKVEEKIIYHNSESNDRLLKELEDISLYHNNHILLISKKQLKNLRKE